MHVTRAIEWIYSRQVFGIKPGLERLALLLADLGNPHETIPTVLVGGTNGKGTVARITAAALQHAGHSVGLFTSPHLHTFGERLLINGAQPPSDVLAELITRIKPFAEQREATFFEIVTALALLYFADQHVDIAVLEVGLGGTYDATNITNPVAAAVVSVALDHTEILGNTVAEIARDKAGIFRPGVPAVTGASESALAVLQECAAAQGAPLTSTTSLHTEVLEHSLAGQRFTLTWEHEQLTVSTPLIGVHQPSNIAVAYLLCRALRVPTASFVHAAAHAKHPARLELIPGPTTWLIDGAHNPAAASALAATLTAVGASPQVLLLGTSHEKDQAELANTLAGIAPRVVVAAAEYSPRATPTAELQRLFPGGLAANSIANAVATAERLAAGGMVLVAGSLFLAAEVRALVLGIASDEQERQQ